MVTFKGYKPKSGVNAGIENRKRVSAYLKKNEDATGVEIAKALGLSLPTVYAHIKHIKYGVES